MNLADSSLRRAVLGFFVSARMSDFPWFPFWATDFVSSRKVRTMTAEQVGIYTLLLCHQWTDGPLPDDAEDLSALANGAEPNVVRTTLERCFTSTPEGWVNERLEDVRGEQEAKRARYVKAGKASGKARRSKGSGKRTSLERRSKDVRTSPEQSESESEPEEQRVAARAAPKSWSAEACEVWNEVTGGTAPGGRIGKALKPLVEEHGKRQVIANFERYLIQHRDEERLEFANPQDFASRYGYYADNGSSKKSTQPSQYVSTEWLDRNYPDRSAESADA